MSYDGFYNFSALADDTNSPLNTSSSLPLNNPSSTTGTHTGVKEDGMSNFPLPTNNFSWQNMPMDIDQDWSWFLNDSNTTTNANGGVNSAGNNGGLAAGTGAYPLTGMDGYMGGGFTGFG